MREWIKFSLRLFQLTSCFSIILPVTLSSMRRNLHQSLKKHMHSNREMLISLCKIFSAAAAAKSLQSCLTLCDPIDGSPPGFPVSGILQARTLEWVAISFSNAWKWKVKVKPLSHVRLLVTPWTAAYQASPPMGFSRKEYWSGVPLPSPNVNNMSSVPKTML